MINFDQMEYIIPDTSAVEMVENMIPTFSDDSKKAVYLSYRISNFSVSESCALAKVSKRQVFRWRTDSEFQHIDGDGLTALRKKVSNEYMDMQYTRNFRLVMEKDFRTLYMDATAPEKMEYADIKYLEKLRQHYTPQSLATIKQLASGGTVEQPFDFTKLTMVLKREQIEITQEK